MKSFSRCCIAAAACLLGLASLVQEAEASRYERFKDWASDLPGIKRFTRDSGSSSHSNDSSSHNDSSSSGQSRSFSSYLPSLPSFSLGGFGGKSSSSSSGFTGEHDNESISSMMSSLSGNFPSAKMSVRSDFRELTTKGTYYYGGVDSDGEKHGDGLFYDKESGSFYLGGWCNNCRNGLGISFWPRETEGFIKSGSVTSSGGSFDSSAKYSVGIHRWKMGFIQEHVSATASFGEHTAAILRLLETKGYSLNGLVDLLNAMVDSGKISHKSGCSEDGFVGVKDSATGAGGANKPFYQEVSIGEQIDPAISSIGSYSTDKTLSNSFIIPFKVSGSRQACVQLFSLEENFHPTAVLFEVDESSTNSKKKLVGRKIASGHAITTSFSDGKKYYLEVGNPTSGSTISNTQTSGKYQVLLLEKAAMNEIYNRTYSITSDIYTYKFSLGGTFTQKDNAGTRNIGTYSKEIAPFWDTNDTSITFYFVNGENCNGTPRLGKLDIAFDNSADELKLLNVQESPTCVYKVNADSKYVGVLRDTISSSATKKSTSHKQTFQF